MPNTGSPAPSSSPNPIDDTSPPTSVPEQENKFQKAISAWRTVNLGTLIPQLDSTAAEIVSNQRDALVERKELAQKTKDFRKLPDDGRKLEEYKSLLKSYQGFIDLVTTHGKASQSAFLGLYEKVGEAPDPFPLLEASVEALVSSEDVLPRVKGENEELRRRVGRLTGQLEESEKRVQEESGRRMGVEKGEGDKMREMEERWTKVLEEKQNNWEAKERVLEEKVEGQERLIKELKASYEVAQRLGGGQEGEQALGKAAQAELDMLSTEFEKTSARLSEMEARNEQLRMDLAKASSQRGAGEESEADLLRLRAENSSLLRKAEQARFDKQGEQRDQENKLKQAERQRSQLIAEIDELRGKVQRWSDYDELKRELDVLRTIELSVDDEDTVEHPANGSIEKGKDSLEQLLLARNKKLSSDMTLLRVSHQESQTHLETLQEELSRTNAELEKSQKLASMLEIDLLKLQEEASNALPSSAMSVAGTYTSRYPTGSMRRGRASPTSSIISGYETVPRPGGSTLESLRSGEPVGGGSGILPMIQAQRDRFKQKNQQLEEELQKTYTSVTTLRQEVASLQKDNLSLYEKSRYVSAYSRGGGASSSALGAAPSHMAVHADEDVGADGRWKSQYEANISPFAAFRGRESARAYKRMSLPERIIFSLTRIVLATRISRNLFAVYCTALHVLVFVMLYWTSTAGLQANVVGEQVRGSGGKVPGSKWQADQFG